MNYKGISELSGLNQKTIRRLEKLGVISEPLTEEQLFVILPAVALMWGDEELIRLQLANHSSVRRAKIVFGSGYNRWERAIITRLLFHYSDREDNKSNLYISQIVDEVMNYNKFPEAMRNLVTKTAKVLRRKINNMMYRNIPLKDIAERLMREKKPRESNKSNSKFDISRQERQNDILGFN
jgi:hypothetical protein